MSRQTNLPRLTTSLSLVAALVGPPLFVVVTNWLFGRSPALAIQVVLHILFCGLAALIVWVVMRREHLPLESIGVRRPNWSTLISAIVLWGLTMVLTPLISQPVLDTFGKNGLEAGVHELAVLPIWFRVIAGFTGGMVEESMRRVSIPALAFHTFQNDRECRVVLERDSFGGGVDRDLSGHDAASFTFAF